MEEDKEIAEILLELAEEENRMLRYENNMLKRLIKTQEYNYRDLVARIDDIFAIERRYN